MLRVVGNLAIPVRWTSSNLRGAGAAWHTGSGTTVTLVYDTKFAQGAATEQFVWHISDNAATLYGYHINSNDLISK